MRRLQLIVNAVVFQLLSVPRTTTVGPVRRVIVLPGHQFAQKATMFRSRRWQAADVEVIQALSAQKINTAGQIKHAKVRYVHPSVWAVMILRSRKLQDVDVVLLCVRRTNTAGWTRRARTM